MSERVAFENARIVTSDTVVEAGLIVDDGVIQELAPKGSGDPGRHRSRRRLSDAGAWSSCTPTIWNASSRPAPRCAGRPMPPCSPHDQQVSAAGITTVCDAVAVGFHDGKQERTEFLQRSIDALGHAMAAGALKADHHLHLRCEVTSPHVVEMFDPLKDHPSLRVVSFMDHTPGQRQWHDMEKYRYFHAAGGRRSAAELDALVEKRLEEQKALWRRPSKSAARTHPGPRT